MFYGILTGAFVIWSAFCVYQGYAWNDKQHEIKLLKAKVVAQRRATVNAQKALKVAQEEESKDKATEIKNDDLLAELQSKINNITDNPECTSSDFMHSLRNLR